MFWTGIIHILDILEDMKLTGLARNTYYKYKKELKADLYENN